MIAPMKKDKALVPSLREKKRYLAFEIISEGAAGAGAACRDIEKALLAHLGTFGMAKAGAFIVKDSYSPRTGRGVIRVSSAGLDRVRASLALITEIGGKKAAVRSMLASGMLHKALAEVRKCRQ